MFMFFRLGGERERKDFSLVAAVGNLDHLTSNDGLLAPPCPIEAQTPAVRADKVLGIHILSIA